MVCCALSLALALPVAPRALNAAADRPPAGGSAKLMIAPAGRRVGDSEAGNASVKSNCRRG